MNFIATTGMNFITLENLEALKVEAVEFTSGLVLVPGDRFTRLGKAKRASFSAKPGHFYSYEGLVTIDNVDHLVFSLDGKRTIDGEPPIYWFMALVCVPEQAYISRLLLFTENCRACMDINVDAIEFYSDEFDPEEILA